MGCCRSRRPHTSAKDASELQMMIEDEEKYLQKLIDQNKTENPESEDTQNLNYVNRLYLVKSSLTQLHYKINTNKDDINARKNQDWNMLMEIFDKYFELRDENFIEKNDILDMSMMSIDAKDKSDTRNLRMYSPTKEFLKYVDEYLGYEAEESIFEQ
jgi:hypothetical protein